MGANDNLHFETAIPVLKSKDYNRSRHFFEVVLGFELVEEGGNPSRFGIFRRDKSIIYVNAWHGGPEGNTTGWSAYFHLSGLDRLFDKLKAKGAPITRPIEATNYGMREFEITDPDGNILCFGEDLNREDGNETD